MYFQGNLRWLTMRMFRFIRSGILMIKWRRQFPTTRRFCSDRSAVKPCRLLRGKTINQTLPKSATGYTTFEAAPLYSYVEKTVFIAFSGIYLHAFRPGNQHAI